MFWNQPNLEPDRQYRWYIDFPSAGKLSGLRYALKKASRPTVKISEVTHKYLNHFYYYPGRLEWEPIQISFASVKVGATLNPADQILIGILETSGYVFPKGATKGSDTPDVNNLNTIAKGMAVGALTSATGNTSISIVQINEKGVPTATWYLWNPFFTEMKYDSLEYASEEILNIDCTIKYDYATLNDNKGSDFVK